MGQPIRHLPGDEERRAYVQGIADKYTTEHLRKWSAGLLAPGMISEDAAALDVAAAYILKLEAALKVGGS